MSSPEPITIARVALYEKPLEEALLNFSLMTLPTISILGTTRQFTFYEEREPAYLLMTSQSLYQIKPGQYHNVTLTVTSENRERAVFVVDEFQRKTGIELKDTPADWLKHIHMMNECFKVVKKFGPRALEPIKR